MNEPPTTSLIRAIMKLEDQMDVWVNNQELFDSSNGTAGKELTSIQISAILKRAKDCGVESGKPTGLEIEGDNDDVDFTIRHDTALPTLSLADDDATK